MEKLMAAAPAAIMRIMANVPPLAAPGQAGADL
jgi:hypothetical protein